MTAAQLTRIRALAAAGKTRADAAAEIGISYPRLTQFARYHGIKFCRPAKLFPRTVVMDEIEREDLRRAALQAKQDLAHQIALAQHESPSAPAYRKGDLEW
jgi:hypothetical protein